MTPVWTQVHLAAVKEVFKEAGDIKVLTVTADAYSVIVSGTLRTDCQSSRAINYQLILGHSDIDSVIRKKRAASEDLG